jgi:peptidoglycan/xylan/chitin deacetylase (PgdA/CDA1 family)
MNGFALILTYHAVEDGPPPLCADPGLFGEHLDVLVDAGAVVMTVGEVAERLRRWDLPERAVAITFDDGFASVAEHAAPRLADREMPATVFAVVGALGGVNDWPSQPRGAPRRPLLGGRELVELARAGFEIGSHGVEHAPLSLARPEALRREIVRSREILEQVLQRSVRSFAYPYNELAGPEGRELVRSTYAGACGGGMSIVRPGADPWRLARIDAHYLRRPELLGRAVAGSLDAYLRFRRIGAGARRLVKKDFERAAA